VTRTISSRGTASEAVDRRHNSSLVLRCVAVATIVTAAILPLSLKKASAEAPVDVTSQEAQFVTMINALRADKGSGPLALSNELDPVARAWTAKMVAQGAISHNPNLAKEVTAVTKNWKKLGENVGFDNTLGVVQLNAAFVASPAHYRNLVDPDFDQVAITIVYETPQQQAAHPADDPCRANPCFYVTEQFMDTAQQPAATSAEPKQTDGSAPSQLALGKGKAKPTAKPKAKPLPKTTTKKK
jgi:uncharacterized protein YkwD